MSTMHENPRLTSVSTKDQLLDSSDSVDGLDTEEQHHHEQQQQQKQIRLPMCRKILFGLAAPPLQMTGNICGFFFSMFLLEVVHLSPLLVSVITFTGRAWDAVTDPLVGQLVFRTKTRIGRTKPWLIVATILGPVTFLLMWLHVPALESSVQKFLYYLVCYLAYCLLITCYHVPYTSSTVLISNNSKDKDGATAARIGFELIFTIIGSGVFGVVINLKRLASNCKVTEAINATVLELHRTEERNGYMLAGGIIAAMYLMCGIFAVGGIKELPSCIRQTRQTDSFFKNIRDVLTFRPYLMLMFSFLFMSLGIQIVQVNLGLYTTHSVGLGSDMNYGIMTVLSVAVLSVPFWYKMADRFGKKRVFIAGLVPMFPCLLFATFMPAQSRLCYYSVCAISGLSISVAMLMPWSMLPDVIDEYYLLHDERKESVFYSLYVFFTKFASGISLALSQLALSASSYNSELCTQPESVGAALRYLVGPGPVLFIAVAMTIMWFYPIDKARREELNALLVAKLGGSGGQELQMQLARVAGKAAELAGQADIGCMDVCSDIEEVEDADLKETKVQSRQDHQEEKEATVAQYQELRQQQDFTSGRSAGSGGSDDSGVVIEGASSDCLLLMGKKS